MAERLPDGITREHLLAAIDDLDHNASHTFGKSVSWDVLYEGRRYAPKAVVGLAATKVTGRPYGPYDFKGGVSTICFRILRENHTRRPRQYVSGVPARRFSQLPEFESSRHQLRRRIRAIHGGSPGGSGGDTGNSKGHRSSTIAVRWGYHI